MLTFCAFQIDLRIGFCPLRKLTECSMFLLYGILFAGNVFASNSIVMSMVLAYDNVVSCFDERRILSSHQSSLRYYIPRAAFIDFILFYAD